MITDSYRFLTILKTAGMKLLGVFPTSVAICPTWSFTEENVGEVVHDSRYKNALQPVSNLLNYAVQLFPPFLRDRDFPCPMIQT